MIYIITENTNQVKPNKIEYDIILGTHQLKSLTYNNTQHVNLGLYAPKSS